MTLPARRLDLAYASASIGPKQQAENSGHEIVEFPAFHNIGKVFAFGAGRYSLLSAACPDCAPRRLVVAGAAGASLFEVGTARSAIKTAIGNQRLIRRYASHQRLLS